MPIGLARAAMTHEIGGAPPPAAVTTGSITAPAAFSADGWAFNHAVLDTEDDMILLAVLVRRNNDVTATYGGVSPSGSQLSLRDIATDIRVYWFYWLNAILPSPGTNIAVAITTSGLARGYAAVIPLRGAEQVAPEFQINNLSGTSISTPALTAAGGSFVGSAIHSNDNANITPAGGSGSWNTIVDAQETLNADWCYIGYLLDQNGSITPSGSWSGATDVAMNAIRVDPA